MEISYKKPIVESQSYSHLHSVMQVALSYISVKDRHAQLALIDVNKDLFLIAIRTTGFERVCKIGMNKYIDVYIYIYVKRIL